MAHKNAKKMFFLLENYEPNVCDHHFRASQCLPQQKSHGGAFNAMAKVLLQIQEQNNNQNGFTFLHFIPWIEQIVQQNDFILDGGPRNLCLRKEKKARTINGNKSELEWFAQFGVPFHV